MVTISDVVEATEMALTNEKKHLQTVLVGMALSRRYIATWQIAEETHLVRHVMKMLHRQGDELVDSWVREVLEPLQEPVERHTSWKVKASAR